jgi:hypothetical protein
LCSPEDTPVEGSPAPPKSPTYATATWEKEPLSSLQLAAIIESTQIGNEMARKDLKETEIQLEQNDEESDGKEHDVGKEARIEETK